MGIYDVPIDRKLIVVGVGGLIVGFASGYIFAQVRGNKMADDVDYIYDQDEEVYEEVEESDDEEVEEVEESDDEEVEESDDEEVEVTSVHTNIFSNGEELTEISETELEEKKLEGEPYVIPVHVFLENEHDWRQETLTYYAGDDIVSDQSDAPIYNYSNLLGELRFGHGSNDPNVVYIRNEAVRMEWEVLRHTGHYLIEVRGLEIESEYEEKDLKHSADRKFREI